MEERGLLQGWNRIQKEGLGKEVFSRVGKFFYRKSLVLDQ